MFRRLSDFGGFAARGFTFAPGCVQAQSCRTDRCPSGLATQNPLHQRALVVPTR